MRRLTLAAGMVFLTFSTVAAETAPLDPLFERLVRVSPDDAPQIEGKIVLEWSKSGSAAMDLLLSRGQSALEAERIDEALQHFSALTDHAPDFAEGWHMLATVYFGDGKYGPALDALEKTLRLEPRHFHAMFGLVLILNESQQYDQALKIARMIQDIHPHYDGLEPVLTRLDAIAGGQSI